MRGNRAARRRSRGYPVACTDPSVGPQRQMPLRAFGAVLALLNCGLTVQKGPRYWRSAVTTVIGLFLPALVCILSMAACGVQAPSEAAARHNEVSADDVVTALEGAYGVHPGERRNHTKGTCALGTFVGSTEAAVYSRSTLFSGSSIPVVARFSLAGGNPTAPDADRSPRGMALEFRLPNGSLQH